MKKFIVITLSILFIVCSLLVFGNEFVVLTKYDVYSENVDEGLDGFKIIFLGDLHNKGYLDNYNRLVSHIEREKPDIIVMVGDMVDGKTCGYDRYEKLLQRINPIAPLYFSLGNEEYHLNKNYNNPEGYVAVMEMMERNGVNILNEREMIINHGESQILLLGILRVDKHCDDAVKDLQNDGMFTICMDHYPNGMYRLREYDVDLVLSGHNHGGVLRIPFKGGLFGHDQGFFPAYDYGWYESKGTQMIITSGLSSGKKGIPRINNFPEVVSITLRSERAE